MNQRQLFRMALLSSPIIAAVELSPVFFLIAQNHHVNFLRTYLAACVFTYFIWLINILVIHIRPPHNQDRKSKLERLVLSYLFSFLFFAFIWIVLQIFPSIENLKEKPSVIFPLINISALNTIVLIISSTIIMRNKKLQTEKELDDLKIKHLEAEQQQLIQQMQPHFLFNALSTLNSIISTDPDLAKKYLIQLSNFLRFTVSAHENSLVPLADELKFTRDYIGLQQLRFEDCFFYDISIPDELIYNYIIPVYSLQSLVENAIKHNLFNAGKPLKVSIRFENDCLYISNNKSKKAKLPENLREGVGLRNLNKRYLLSTGHDIQINETAEEFTVVLKLIRKEL